MHRLQGTLGLPIYAQKHGISLVLLRYSTGDLTNPPVEGACYGLGLGAQGEWADHDGDIALFFNAEWQFLTPQPGWRAWDISTVQLKIFTADQ